MEAIAPQHHRPPRTPIPPTLNTFLSLPKLPDLSQGIIFKKQKEDKGDVNEASAAQEK